MWSPAVRCARVSGLARSATQARTSKRHRRGPTLCMSSILPVLLCIEDALEVAPQLGLRPLWVHGRFIHQLLRAPAYPSGTFAFGASHAWKVGEGGRDQPPDLLRIDKALSDLE